MTLTIDLPQDLAHELATEASKLGIPLSEYALRLLYSRELTEKKPKTGDELVAYWQEEELIESRKEIDDSQVYARQIRTQAETRVRE
ncbi:MAG: hypothetical protein M5U34_37035 [Chloroflexi bacterium]|nr:hypothetical protein [Chloroflexota bacterium]